MRGGLKVGSPALSSTGSSLLCFPDKVQGLLSHVLPLVKGSAPSTSQPAPFLSQFSSDMPLFTGTEPFFSPGWASFIFRAQGGQSQACVWVSLSPSGCHEVVFNCLTTMAWGGHFAGVLWTRVRIPVSVGCIGSITHSGLGWINSSC